MLLSGKPVLDKANAGNYAVGAFNINNMEILQAIIAAAEQEKSPVILQTSQGAIKYAGIDYLSSMVKLAASKTDVPVVLHLDHGSDFDICMQCIRHGWTSVMIDASHHSFEENVKITKEVVRAAHAAGVAVEAELGRLSGIEEHVSVDEKDAVYTNPDEAKEFIKQTGIDYLAIAIGTAHGKYAGEPKLDFERLDTIKKLLGSPIVLHGSSGIKEGDIKKAVSLGVNKINIDTDIRQAFTDGIKAVFDKSPDEFDPRKICGPARDLMKEVVISKIKMFGSSNKA